MDTLIVAYSEFLATTTQYMQLDGFQPRCDEEPYPELMYVDRISLDPEPANEPIENM